MTAFVKNCGGWVHSDDRLLSEPTAGTHPCLREPLFMPLSGRSLTPPGSMEGGPAVPVGCSLNRPSSGMKIAHPRMSHHLLIGMYSLRRS